jgi:integrase
MAIHKLTTRKVETAKTGKYEDGGGLRLVVSRTGGKKWVFRFTLHATRHEMGLGGYPATSLRNARELAAEHRETLTLGIDPRMARNGAEPVIPTFTQCAAQYIKEQRRAWKSIKHAKQWVATLKQHARPVIGHLRVDEIETQHILKILKPIWQKTNETAKRTQGRIENILDFAAAQHLRDNANPARWRGHLDKLLAKPSRLQKVRHHPAMPYEEVPKYMGELQALKNISAKSLQFLILTATRTSEVLKAQWCEVNLEKNLWVIPAERMKAGKSHTVPLSSSAIDILQNMPKQTGNPYIFPGTKRGAAQSNMVFLALMKRMGYGNQQERGEYVPHGFRSSFRDWASEESSHPHSVVEMALAHTIQNKAEAAYRRRTLIEKRRLLMQSWDDYINCKKL